jgi:hypothetical protein
MPEAAAGLSADGTGGGSAPTRATPNVLRRDSAAGVNHVACLGSHTMASRYRPRTSSKNPATMVASKFSDGGSWTRTGPRFSAKPWIWSKNATSGSRASVKPRSCVIVRGSFIANRNSGGVLSRHLAYVAAACGR